MIDYISVGVDDMARAKRFYTAFLPALGYELDEADGELGFALPVPPGGGTKGTKFGFWPVYFSN